MPKREISIITSLIFAIVIIIGTANTQNQIPTDPTTSSITETMQSTQTAISTDNNKTGPYRVTKVVDGDTIEIDLNNKKTKIRIIGINTPETVDPRKVVECFGTEASNKAKELLYNKFIYTEEDPSQQNTDKYGRQLRYVFLEDGTNFSELMISNGYGYEYTYDNPYRYIDSFKQAQQIAESNKAGLWADNACK